MSTIERLTSRQHKEAGMVAIMVTLILMIVISLIVLGFAQISRRNQRQALDRQLSTQAFYAAETGVNDAAEIIKAAIAGGNVIPAKPDCAADGGGFYNGLDAVIDDASNVEYTCLTVNPTPSSLEYTGIGTISTVVPLFATSGNIASVTFTWYSKDNGSTPADGCRPNMTDPPFLTTSEWNASNCGYGVLRFDLVPTAGGALTMDTLRTQTMTSFLVPLTPTGSGAALNPTAYSASGNNSRLGVRCTSTSCTQTIDSLGGNQYYLRVTSIYKDVRLVVTANDASGNPLNLQGAQAVIDVTGKAEDVLRRIQVRLPLSGSSTNLASDYAIQSTEAICKRFSAMDGFFSSDANNMVSTVGASTTNPLCD